MSMTGLDVFDMTVQQTNIWLKDIMQELGWADRHKAYLGLRTTLHALRDRLTPEEATQFDAQLSMLIRGLCCMGWTLTGKPDKVRHKAEFLAPIRDHFRDDWHVEPEEIARAVRNSRHSGVSKAGRAIHTKEDNHDQLGFSDRRTRGS